MNKFKLNDISSLTYSELFLNIHELEKEKLDLYTKLSNFNYSNDEYGKNHRVTISCGKSLGAAGSFMVALFSRNLICDYYGNLYMRLLILLGKE